MINIWAPLLFNDLQSVKSGTWFNKDLRLRIASNAPLLQVAIIFSETSKTPELHKDAQDPRKPA